MVKEISKRKEEKDMSTILQILASSAVIVVIIEVVFQSKTNRVQFLTSSRAEWRSNLKQYAEELSKSNYRNISQVLTKIKVNLNGYGCYNKDEYPSDEQLDFFRDEHIWKEINCLEVACASKHPSKKIVEEHKQRLIKFLGLLLKFDWERSKDEIKMNLTAIASILAFSIMIITCFLQMTYNKADTLMIWKTAKRMITMVIPFLILWAPCLVEVPKLFKIKKWYKNVGSYPFTWAVGAIMQLCFLYNFKKTYKIDINIPMLFYLIAMFLAIMYPLMRRNMFIEYDNKIIRIMKIDSLVVYSMGSELSTIRVLSFFIKHGVNSSVESYKDTILNNHEFKTYLKKLPNQKKLLHIFSRIKYCIRKEEDVLKFAKEKPKRCKLIVSFQTQDPESKIEFSIGFQKKKWRKWIQ